MAAKSQGMSSLRGFGELQKVLQIGSKSGCADSCQVTPQPSTRLVTRVAVSCKEESAGGTLTSETIDVVEDLTNAASASARISPPACLFGRPSVCASIASIVCEVRLGSGGTFLGSVASSRRRFGASQNNLLRWLLLMGTRWGWKRPNVQELPNTADVDALEARILGYLNLRSGRFPGAVWGCLEVNIRHRWNWAEAGSQSDGTG